MCIRGRIRKEKGGPWTWTRLNLNAAVHTFSWVSVSSLVPLRVPACPPEGDLSVGRIQPEWAEVSGQAQLADRSGSCHYTSQCPHVIIAGVSLGAIDKIYGVLSRYQALCQVLPGHCLMAFLDKSSVSGDIPFY